jgi:hypothetical protein
VLQDAAREEALELPLHELRESMAVAVLRGGVQERVQMRVDHAVQHAALGGAGLIAGKAVGHVDDVGATSGLRQCRETDTCHAWGQVNDGGRRGGCLFLGTPAW